MEHSIPDIPAPNRRKPTSLQRLFAQIARHFWATPATGALVVLVLAVKECQPSLVLLHNGQWVLSFLAIVIFSPVFGFYATILLMFYAGPIFAWRGQVNGGPFEVGDVVQVLAGPYRGKITTVYSSWQGGSVRVRLGAKEEESFKDVFGSVELLREDRSHEPADRE